ncbi:hypothetical protein [Dictyobacter arantiisoli]|uniref:Uncharacterized protein n=1 Tax=Dictyobacter arantiisoli TaxID=2014874 RepID=A0A5A5THD5_9CHLR|nr:hypothetical protein [Dictyobacter arantiisoli]GCF10556.1 hypothetical protein KDI_41200 [Dictyobacter arantiisoli]
MSTKVTDFLISIFQKFFTRKLFAQQNKPLSVVELATQKWKEPAESFVHLSKYKKPTIPMQQAIYILWEKQSVSLINVEEHVLKAQNLLRNLPVNVRAETLGIAYAQDLDQCASRLIDLAPFKIDGFSALARTIQQDWELNAREDDLALAFYRVLTVYGFSLLEAAVAQVRLLNRRVSSSKAKIDFLESLREIIQQLPVAMRSKMLSQAYQDDYIQLAEVLIDLNTFKIEGLKPIAAAIKQAWDEQERSDALALSFYRVVTAYGLDPIAALESIVRILVKLADYAQAEAVLCEAFTQGLLFSADLYWRFLGLVQRLERPPMRQLELLQHFVNHYPRHQTLGLAFKKIGDLFGDSLDDYAQALKAYTQAEEHGMVVPQLQSYRAGDWDTIPALRKHPDYKFPPVVVVDLEVDPQSGAPVGSRVFEVAAVRYRGEQYVIEERHIWINMSHTSNAIFVRLNGMQKKPECDLITLLMFRLL